MNMNGFSPMCEEYARAVESVSRDIGLSVGLDQDQMTKRGFTVLYPFDMTAPPDKRKKIQGALREHLPKLRKFDPCIMGLMRDLELARYADIK